MIVTYYASDDNKNKVCVLFRMNPVLNEAHYIVCILEGKTYNEYTYETEEFDTAMNHYKDVVKDFKKGGGDKYD